MTFDSRRAEHLQMRVESLSLRAALALPERVQRLEEQIIREFPGRQR